MATGRTRLLETSYFPGHHVYKGIGIMPFCWLELIPFVLKHFFNRSLKKVGDPEGCRKAWIEFLLLNGIDGLPGNAYRVGEVALGEVLFGP